LLFPIGIPPSWLSAGPYDQRKAHHPKVNLSSNFTLDNPSFLCYDLNVSSQTFVLIIQELSFPVQWQFTILSNITQEAPHADKRNEN
ncbi:MAG: hypothetical protein LUF34_07970, partial [Lachnospiraceae bacterium]|nr:hypothetical protein [Lachnospiraceae bacterium]